MMKKTQTVFLKSAAETRAWAAGFARGLRAPSVVALHGDLGAGKSEIARAIIQTLCGEDTVVPSPTFTIAQTYKTADNASLPDQFISHFDLYRIADRAELEEIGLRHAIANDVVLIEWPEIAADFLPDNTAHIFISEKNDGRFLEVSQCCGQWNFSGCKSSDKNVK